MSDMLPPDQGMIRIITPEDPAVGDEISIQQPAIVRWRFISLIAFFTAGAGVFDREPALGVLLGGNIVFRSQAKGKLTTGEDAWIEWYAGPSLETTFGPRQITGIMPEKFLMNNQMKIETDTDDMQAVDQWSLIALMVEEWMEPLS